MDSKIMLSVIIPVYNTEKYLFDCLNSVIMQEFQNIEIICVDDNSTDGSFSVLQSYEKKYSNFRVFKNGSKGVSSARNLGIDKARGRYILFLDSDDMLQNNCLNDLITKCETNYLDILYFSYMNFHDNENIAIKYKNKKVNQSIRKGIYDSHLVLDGSDMIKAFVGNSDFVMAVTTCIIRRKHIIDNKIHFENILFEDAPFSLELLMKASRVSCINEVCYLRRIRDNSIEHGDFTGYHLYSYFKSCVYMYRILEANKSICSGIIDECSTVMTRRITALRKKYQNIDENHYLDFTKKCSQVEYILFFSLIKSQADIIRNNNDKISTIKTENVKLKENNIQLKNRIKSIRSSKQFKIGGMILYPIRKLKRL